MKKQKQLINKKERKKLEHLLSCMLNMEYQNKFWKIMHDALKEAKII